MYYGAPSSCVISIYSNFSSYYSSLFDFVFILQILNFIPSLNLSTIALRNGSPNDSWDIYKSLQPADTLASANRKWNGKYKFGGVHPGVRGSGKVVCAIVYSSEEVPFHGWDFSYEGGSSTSSEKSSGYGDVWVLFADRTLSVYDALAFTQKNLAVLDAFPLHGLAEDDIVDLLFFSDGLQNDYMAIITKREGIILVDRSDLTCDGSVPRKHSKLATVDAVAHLKEKSQVWTADSFGFVVVWTYFLQNIKVHSSFHLTHSVQLTAQVGDDVWLAGSLAVSVVDSRGLQVKTTWQAHFSVEIVGLHFTEPQNHVWTIGKNGTVNVWHAESFDLVETFHVLAGAGQRETVTVTSTNVVHVSNMMSAIAIGSSDGSVSIWDAHQYEEVQKFDLALAGIERIVVGKSKNPTHIPPLYTYTDVSLAVYTDVNCAESPDSDSDSATLTLSLSPSPRAGRPARMVSPSLQECLLGMGALDAAMSSAEKECQWGDEAPSSSSSSSNHSSSPVKGLKLSFQSLSSSKSSLSRSRSPRAVASSASVAMVEKRSQRKNPNKVRTMIRSRSIGSMSEPHSDSDTSVDSSPLGNSMIDKRSCSPRRSRHGGSRDFLRTSSPNALSPNRNQSPTSEVANKHGSGF